MRGSDFLFTFAPVHLGAHTSLLFVSVRTMAYIKQNIEIKNAPKTLVDFVRKLGEEKHARMQELRNCNNFTYTIHI